MASNRECSSNDHRLIDVVEEVLQVLLQKQNLVLRHKVGWGTLNQMPISSQTEQSLGISVALKCKKLAIEKSYHVFSLKVTWTLAVNILQLLRDQHLPRMSVFVETMQEIGQEGVLAFQSTEPDNTLTTKSYVVWLSCDSMTGTHEVTVLRESTKESDEKGALHSLQLRLLLSHESVLKDAKRIGDLLQRLKAFYFQVDFSFTAQIERGSLGCGLSLRDKESIQCGDFILYKGAGIYARKPQWVFGDESVSHIHCGETVDLTNSITLTSIVCFVPQQLPQKLDGDGSKGNESCPQGKIDGSVLIRLYGPTGFPYCVEHFELNPSALASWKEFGLQLKTSYKTKCYDIECQARLLREFHGALMNNPEVNCKFTLCVMFVISHKNKTKGPDCEETSRDLHNQSLSEITKSGIDMEEKLRESMKSSLAALFGKTLPEVEPEISKTDCTVSGEQTDKAMVLYKQMIPDVVSSLVDIYVKSTNSDFRDCFQQLIGKENRLEMCEHLESCLWKVAGKSGVCSVESTTQSPEKVADYTHEDQDLTKWSPEEQGIIDCDKSMSPDSLDSNFDWNHKQENAVNANDIDENPLNDTTHLNGICLDSQNFRDQRKFDNDGAFNRCSENSKGVTKMGQINLQLQDSYSQSKPTGFDMALQFELEHNNRSLYWHDCFSSSHTSQGTTDHISKMVSSGIPTSLQEQISNGTLFLNMPPSYDPILKENSDKLKLKQPSSTKSFPRKRSSEFMEEVTRDFQDCCVSDDSHEKQGNKKSRVTNEEETYKKHLAQDSSSKRSQDGWQEFLALNQGNTNLSACFPQPDDGDQNAKSPLSEFSQHSLNEEDHRWSQSSESPSRLVESCRNPQDNSPLVQNDSEDWFSEGELANWCEDMT